MDKRLGDLVEGAGLEESRINADFKDWLAKWGGPILFVVLAIALSYRGYIWWKGKQVQNLDSAFIELDDAMIAGNPAGLIQISRDWEGEGSVPELAKLEAADRFLMAVAVGVKPGGDPAKEDDLLSDEEKQQDLDQAGRLFKDVYESTRDSVAKVLLRLRAMSGMASILVTRGDVDAGREQLGAFIEIAEKNGLTGLADSMRDRLEELAANRKPTPMVPQADIFAYKPIAPSPTDDEGFMTPDELLNELGPVPPDATPAPDESATPAPDASEQSAPGAAPESAPAEPEESAGKPGETAPAEPATTPEQKPKPPEKKPPSAGG